MQKECIIRICTGCGKPLPWSTEESGQTGWLCCDEYYCSEVCLGKSFDEDYTKGLKKWEERHYSNSSNSQSVW